VGDRTVRIRRGTRLLRRAVVMVMGKTRFLQSTVYRLAVLGVVFGLAACNPVETWRDWTGASKNDPDPETTPNTQNLAAGETTDYPNLATVPPPPNRALTAAEREKLTQSLIADRTNAKYSDEKLRAGFPAVSAPAPPPPPPPVPVTPDEAQAKPTTAPAPPSPAPTVSPDTGGTAGKTAASPGQGLRKSDEPAEPPPMESSLEVPKVRSVPHPEQVQSSPPPLYPMPTPTAANAPVATPHLPSPPAPAPMPEAIGSAAYQPPPPPAVLAPLASSGKSGQKSPAAATGTPVAEINFAADATSLSDEDRQTLGKVVPLYQEHPGKVRIVGYAGAGGGAAEQLNSFRAALDRAQAVAAALTKAGIPADKIAVEAAPSGVGSVENRAEVLLER
jgi:outer membrane protein OmpA-like peptidoglycan-associated protein